MSRSYKKNPIVKDGGISHKKAKVLANRSLRRKTKNADYEISNNSSYKKECESYDIADYIDRTTFEEALEIYRGKSTHSGINYWGSKEFRKICPTEDDFAIYWKKRYTGK